MAPIHYLVTITPAPGKEARLREVLTNIANEVEKNEPGLLRYHFFEQYDGEKGNVFIVQETYEDEAAVAAHANASYFIELKKILPEEGLLAAPLDLKKIQPFAGFASR
ncbi:hypothetical protein BOTCAL_0019g00120 [Botryotinia calthae]|uniref:ABM domain-containing protein n=1 Tax=Botryotinia calthae TaxID=38488 RepID=A0A4Y8DFA5_9HELO|nr:hypothetical protein BOTCAL_0019g00120 [Botryotinia calthae]